MEIERRHAPVPGELLEYLKANPTAGRQAEDGGVHVHVHHHYAAPVVPAGEIVHQGPQPTMAQRIIPWLWTALLACVVLTLCAAILAAVMVVAVAVLAGLALLGLVIAHIISSQAGAIEARGSAAEARGRAAEAAARAESMLRDGKRKRR